MNDSTNVRIIADNIRKLEKMVKEAGSELPTPGAGDTGKILKVGSDGYELATEYSYTPPAYSTSEEVNTHEKWIDGKDIYKLAVEKTLPAGETSVELIHSLNAESIIEYCVVCSQPDAATPSTLMRTDFNRVSCVSNLVTYTRQSSTTSDISVRFIVKYTKPTPANETKKKTTKKG